MRSGGQVGICHHEARHAGGAGGLVHAQDGALGVKAATSVKSFADAMSSLSVIDIVPVGCDSSTTASTRPSPTTIPLYCAGAAARRSGR